MKQALRFQKRFMILGALERPSGNRSRKQTLAKRIISPCCQVIGYATFTIRIINMPISKDL